MNMEDDDPQLSRQSLTAGTIFALPPSRKGRKAHDHGVPQFEIHPRTRSGQLPQAVSGCDRPSRSGPLLSPLSAAQRASHVATPALSFNTGCPVATPIPKLSGKMVPIHLFPLGPLSFISAWTGHPPIIKLIHAGRAEITQTDADQVGKLSAQFSTSSNHPPILPVFSLFPMQDTSRRRGRMSAVLEIFGFIDDVKARRLSLVSSSGLGDKRNFGPQTTILPS
ncbi:hypothetical protein VTN00DRAFT_1669 [Thermoascus crustaceus]|uniref:uncharacterized protein n=1 Tax=Thermoascus crustaceus TaxID=5088 RepID=UPI00374424C6